LRVFVVFIELAGIYFLSKAIGGQFKPEGMEYYSFLLIGTAFLDLTVASIAMFVQSTMEAQVSGTFEVLMTTSTPGSTVLFLSVASTLAGRIIHTLIYLGLGTLVFHAQLHAPDPVAISVIVLIALVTVASSGMIAAALQVLTLRGASLVWLLSVTAGLMSGVMFPIEVLPAPLLQIAKLNPFAMILSALRAILVHGKTLGEVSGIPVLVVTAIALAILGPWAFSQALRRARLRGTLGQY
jgi:ABC-2 type transport system permease protein